MFPNWLTDLRFDKTNNKQASGSADKALSKTGLLGLFLPYKKVYLIGLMSLSEEVP